MLQSSRIGFLGAGSISEALVRGMLSARLVNPEQIRVSNRSSASRLAELGARWSIRTSSDRRQVTAESDVLIIACKPKDVAGLLEEVGDATRSGQMILSVAAGVATQTIADLVRPGVQVVRAMPNTSSLVRESATAICAGTGTGPDALLAARVILEAVGQVVEVEERLLDAVTGLSGTGPAYIYLMMESMVAAGVAVGLPQETATALARQTIVGAARMLAETGEDPSLLRQQVTSPGGTTMAAMQVLGDLGFQQAMIKAVTRATERAGELGAMVAPSRASAGD